MAKAKKKTPVKNYSPDTQVRVFYSLLEKHEAKMNKIFAKHNVEWTFADYISKSGDPTEWGGFLSGTYKDVFRFIKSAFKDTTEKEFKAMIL